MCVSEFWHIVALCFLLVRVYKCVITLASQEINAFVPLYVHLYFHLFICAFKFVYMYVFAL
jgi:hypothetical protein